MAAAAACTRGESQAVDSAAARGRGETVPVSRDVPDPGVRPSRPAYQTAAVAGGGTVTGTVAWEGGAVPPPDSAPTDTAFARLCAVRRARGAPGPAAAAGTGVVVWLEGVRAGKALPGARRYELALDGCRLVPGTLAATAGGTLNVHALEGPPARLVFARAAGVGDAGRVLLRTATSAPGQVVPDERVLAEPGLVEVRGEVGEPRAAGPGPRAWVLAFDHPYFAAPGEDGAFALAEVPAGRYTLVAWHPRAGRVEQGVEVGAGQAVGVALTLRGR